jgi:hypothetical protein
MVSAFLIIALSGKVWRNEILEILSFTMRVEEQYLVLTLYPLTMVIMTMIVGTINPDFFKFNLIRIPIIADATLFAKNGYEEMMVTFDVNRHGCFLRSIESLSGLDDMQLQCDHLNHRSSLVRGIIVWENHDSLMRPVGSLYRFEQYSSANRVFKRFLRHYIAFRITHGLSFNLKLPGFESIRKWFVQPSTILTYDIHYAPGATIFRDGDPSGGFYYIKKGEVEFIKVLSHGKRIRMGVAGKGTIFGEMALAGATRRSMSAVCVSECIMSYADISDLKTLVTNNPEFAHTLILTLASRIGASEKKLFAIIEYLDQQNILQNDVIPEKLMGEQ